MFWKKKEKQKEERQELYGVKLDATEVRSANIMANTNSDANNSTNKRYNDIVNTSDLINSCMNYIANNVGQIRFTIGKYNKDTQRIDEYPDSKLVELFNTSPNEYQTWTELFTLETLSLMVSGNSYTTFEKIRGRYEMYNLLPPQEVKPIINNNTGFISHFKFGNDVEYSRNELIHNKLPSLNSFHIGEPVLTPIIDSLLLEGYAVQDLVQFYNNGSVGSMVLSSDQPLTNKQAEDLSTKIANEYTMTNKNRHKMFVLPNNLKPQAIHAKPKDSLLIEALEVVEDRVLQLFKLHKAVLGGASDRIHYTHNMTTLNEMVFNNAIRPYINRLKDTIESFLKRKFKDSNLVLIIDYTNIPEIHRSILRHYEVARSLNVSGILSLNEAREIVGLPPINEGYSDKHFIPAHLVGSKFVTIEELNSETINELRDSIDTTNTTSLGSDDPNGGKPNNNNEVQ